MLRTNVIKLLSVVFITFTINHPNANAKALIFTQTTLGEKYLCAHNTLIKAYNRLDHVVTFQTLPNKRALKSANEGKYDGEMIRSKGVELNYPNLIRLPIPLCSITSVVLAKKHINAGSFEDLSFEKLKGYRIGITAGFVDQENLNNKYNWGASKAGKHEKLIEMFLKNRVDVIFITEIEANRILQDFPNNGYKILTDLNRPLYLYHYLNEKHRDLIPDVTRELENLQNNGLINLKERRD